MSFDNQFLTQKCLLRLAVTKYGDNKQGGSYLLEDGGSVVMGHIDIDGNLQGSASINLYLTARQLVHIVNRDSTTVYSTVKEVKIIFFA